MRGDERRLYDSSGRVARPFVLRLFHAVIALATIGIVVLAVWIGTRQDDPPGVVTASSAPESLATTTIASEDMAADDTAPSSPSTTAPETTAPTTSAAADTTPTTSAPPTGPASGATRREATFATEPGGSGPILEEASAFTLTGAVRILDGGTWFEAVHGDDTGWLPADSVVLSSSDLDARPCGDIPDSLPPTALAYQPGTADGAADGIAAIERHRSSECQRIVLYLGNGLGTGAGVFSDAFPEDMSVVDLSGRIRVEMAQDIVVIPELAFASIPVQDGQAVAIAARMSSGQLVYNIDGGPARLSVSFLARPARIVLDFIPVGSALPGVGGGVIINAHSLADAAVAGDGRPLQITGWARLLEGLGEVAFRGAPADGAEPGSANAIEVAFDGTPRAGAVVRSWYFYETAVVDGEWAEFRFTISGLEPGDYELFLGLGSSWPAEIAEPGLHQILEVGTP